MVLKIVQIFFKSFRISAGANRGLSWKTEKARTASKVGHSQCKASVAIFTQLAIRS